jgi:hypothetical protein
MSTWICDSCGHLIETPEDGWVEWINLGPSKPGRDLRLVHRYGAGPRRNGCLHNEQAEFARDEGTAADLDLPSFLGPDGLMRLLVFISQSELPIPEVLQMIKRLHIPGYEHAHSHFRSAINAGAFEPNMPEDFYWQSDIKATLKYIAKEGR